MNKLKNLDSVLKKILSKYPKRSYTYELGVIDETNERDEGSKEVKKKPQTNAEILYLMCMGSNLGKVKIPSRDVLKYTADDWKFELRDEMISDLLNKVNNEEWSVRDLDLYMNQYAYIIQEHCRNLITNKDKRIAPNSPYTIEKKGSDTPLIDTGELIEAIICRLK